MKQLMLAKQASLASAAQGWCKTARRLTSGKQIIGTPLPPLTDELVRRDSKGSGLRGWLRVAEGRRRADLLSLYLFLDTYDVRANFNRRMAERRREEARSSKTVARQFKAWARDLWLACGSTS